MTQMGLQFGKARLFRKSMLFIAMLAVITIATAGFVAVSDDDVSSGADRTEFLTDNIMYKVLTEDTTKTVEVIPKTSAYEGEITIPPTVTENSITYTVVSIAKDAFLNSTISKVTIGTNVKTIGEAAFKGCTGLSTIDTKNVTELGASAFEGCNKITTATLTNVTKVGVNAFKNCTKLTTVTSKATQIEVSAFDGCSELTTMTVSGSLTDVKDYAFRNCVKLDMDIPNTLTTLGVSAFEGCAKLDGKDGTISLPSIKVIGNNTFKGCVLVKSVTISDTATSVGTSAFQNCTSLTNFVLPSTVTTVGASAFENCTSLTNFVLPSTVTTVGASAFKDCSGLTFVSLPNAIAVNVTSGTESFSGCNGITRVTLNAGGVAGEGEIYIATYLINWTLPGISGATITTLNVDTADSINLGDLPGATGKSITFSQKSTNVTGPTFYGINGTDIITDKTKLAGYKFNWETSKWVQESLSVTVIVKTSVDGVVTTSPDGGDVTFNPEGTVSAGKHLYARGASITLTAISNLGYDFKAWEGISSSSNVATISSLNENMTITVIFMKVSYILVEITPDSWGTIKYNGNDFESGTYESGLKMTLEATPATGFDFVEWEDGTIEPSRSFTVADNHRITAIFKSESGETYNVYVSSSVGGTITPSTTTPVNSGDPFELTITPNDGYRVECLFVDGTTYYDYDQLKYTISSVTANHVIRVTFTTVDAIDLEEKMITTIPSQAEVSTALTTTAKEGVKYLIKESAIDENTVMAFPSSGTGSKVLEYAVTDEDGNVLYTWTFGKNSIASTGSLKIKVVASSSADSEEVADAKSEVSSHSAFYMDFSASGELPTNTKVTFDIGGSGNTYSLYHYNTFLGVLDDCDAKFVSSEGMITVYLEGCSDYVLIKDNSGSSDDNLVLNVVLTIIIIVITVYVTLMVSMNLRDYRRY